MATLLQQPPRLQKWMEKCLLEDQSVLHGSIPGLVDTRMINGADFMKVPAFKCVHNCTRMTSMDTTSFHGHLAGLEILGVSGQCKSRKISVGALIRSELLERRDNKLMKGSTGWRRCLFLLTAELSNDPVLAVGSSFDLGSMHNTCLCLGRSFVVDLLKPLGTGCEHGHLDSAFGQIEGDGTTKLGSGSRDKDFLDIGWNLLQYSCGGQSVAMNDTSLQVGILVDKEFAATIQSFVLIQGTQSKNPDASGIGFKDCFFDLAVDKLPLTLEKELDRPCWSDPSLHPQGAKAMLVRDKYLAKASHDEHDQDTEWPERCKPPLGLERS